MSFLSQAFRPLRYDRTITSQKMEKQTTMFFDEIYQGDDTNTPIQDRIRLTYNSDTNTLNWITTGNSSYLSFVVKYNSINTTTVSSTTRTFTLSSLTSNTFYSFQIVGTTSFGSTINSNSISITTPPIHPSNFTITSTNITTSSFELIYSKTDGDATNFSFQPSIATTSLNSNTEYSVYATMTYEINGTPHTIQSNTITIQTLHIEPTIDSFSSPSKDHDEITLNFQTTFNDADNTNRVLEIYKDNVLHSSLNQTDTSFTITGLTQATSYQLQLKLRWYFNSVSQTSIDSNVLTITTDTLNPSNPYFELQSKTATSITIYNIDYGDDDGATRLSNNIFLDNVLQSSTIQSTFTFYRVEPRLKRILLKSPKSVQGIASFYEFQRDITTFVNALPATNNGSTTTLVETIPTNKLQWTINSWGDQTPTSIQIIDASNSSVIYNTRDDREHILLPHTSSLENTTYSYKIRKVSIQQDTLTSSIISHSNVSFRPNRYHKQFRSRL
jgi:hypothetical protein